jgi:hypothetical protein
MKLEIGNNGTGKEICKQEKRVAHCVRCERKKKNFVNAKGKLKLFFL